MGLPCTSASPSNDSQHPPSSCHPLSHAASPLTWQTRVVPNAYLMARSTSSAQPTSSRAGRTLSPPMRLAASTTEADRVWHWTWRGEAMCRVRKFAVGLHV